MGAAFEVNRQMCDIDKHLSEAGYFRKICEGQIEARKKLIDMEKKKMTYLARVPSLEIIYMEPTFQALKC